MHIAIPLLLAALGAAAGSHAIAIDGDWSLESTRNVLPRKPLRTPLGGDVIFSARRAQPEAAQIAQSFRANRIEWVYSTDAGFVANTKLKGYAVGLTLNANPIVEGDDGYARNFDGDVVIAPWMKTWGAKWATSTSAKTTSVLLENARRLVAVGADSIQFDDPALQYASATWANGDFSPSSLEGFSKFIQRADVATAATRAGLRPGSPETYKEFVTRTYGVNSAAEYARRRGTFSSTPIWEYYLMSSVREFHASLKKLLATEKSKYTPLSFNLNVQPDERSLFIADIPDYLITESHDFDPASIATRTATTRAIPTGYVASLVPKDTNSTRASIALHYAHGAPVVVPWDVYMPDIAGIAQTRFFAKAQDFTDIFDFVRQNRQLLDHADVPPFVQIAIPLANPNKKELRRIVDILTQHSIPFVFSFSGGLFKKYSLAASQLGAARVVVQLGPATDFNADDAKTLGSLASKAIPASSITDTWAADNTPIKVVNGTGVNLNLRSANSTASVAALHLVTVPSQDRGEPQSGKLRIKIAAELLPKNLKHVRLFGIGKEPETVAFSVESNEVSIDVNRPALWSILIFSREDI